MSRYYVKGFVDLVVTRTEDERERIDEIIEADSPEHARQIAEDIAEDEYDDADDVDVIDSTLTIVVIEESPEERDQRIAREIYHSMVTSGAPRLPGMEAHS